MVLVYFPKRDSVTYVHSVTYAPGFSSLPYLCRAASTVALPLSRSLHRHSSIAQCYLHTFIPWVAAQAVRSSGIPKVARSRLTQCSKSCDLQPSPHCSVQYVELRGYCPVYGEGCDQSIGSTVSDAIVRSWLWLTATKSSPFGYFSKLLQVADNWTHILWY